MIGRKGKKALLVSIPEHLESKEEHDDDGRIVSVDWWNEGGDAKPDQGRDNRHDDESSDGADEDDHLVVAHCKDCCGPLRHILVIMPIMKLIKLPNENAAFLDSGLSSHLALKDPYIFTLDNSATALP